MATAIFLVFRIKEYNDFILKVWNPELCKSQVINRIIAFVVHRRFLSDRQRVSWTCLLANAGHCISESEGKPRVSDTVDISISEIF